MTATGSWCEPVLPASAPHAVRSFRALMFAQDVPGGAGMQVDLSTDRGGETWPSGRVRRSCRWPARAITRSCLGRQPSAAWATRTFFWSEW